MKNNFDGNPENGHPAWASLSFQDFDEHDVVRPILNSDSVRAFETTYKDRIVERIGSMPGVIENSGVYRFAENSENISVVALVHIEEETKTVFVIRNGLVVDMANYTVTESAISSLPVDNTLFVIGITDDQAPYTIAKFNYGNTVTAFLRMMLQLENGDYAEAKSSLVLMKKDLDMETDLLGFLQSSNNVKVANYLKVYGSALEDLEKEMNTMFEELVRIREAVKTAGGAIGSNSAEVAGRMTKAMGRVISMKCIIDKYKSLQIEGGQLRIGRS